MTTQWQHALIASGFAVSSPAFQIQGAPRAAALIVCPFSSGASLGSSMTFTLEQAHDPGKNVASASFAPVIEEDLSAAWSTGAFTKGVFPITNLAALDQVRVVASSVHNTMRSVALILKY